MWIDPSPGTADRPSAANGLVSMTDLNFEAQMKYSFDRSANLQEMGKEGNRLRKQANDLLFSRGFWRAL